MRRKTIQYGVTPHNEFYARCDDRIAFPVLQFNQMQPENKFGESYQIEDCHIFDLVGSYTWNNIKWTKKIPVVVKNQFRKFFNMKPLKEKKGV